MTSALTSHISGNSARKYKENKKAKKVARRGLLEISDCMMRSGRGDTDDSGPRLSKEFIAAHRNNVNGKIWHLIEQIAEIFPGKNTPKIIDGKLGDLENGIRATKNADKQDVDVLVAKILEVRSKVMGVTTTRAELAS